MKCRYGNNGVNIGIDIDELIEILKQNDDKSFIVKPVEGSGGYGIQHLKYNKKHPQLNNSYFENYFKKYFSYYGGQDLLIQEFITGNNISSSVLSTKNQAKAIINSKMLIESDFGEENNFKYSGNIVPYTDISDNKSTPTDFQGIDNEIINDISEKIISKFGLIGSNGVDMIINNDNNDNNKENIYIIEVNPRFQGTYECVEKVLRINLLEAHIKACEGELISVPTAKYCSMKRIIYTKERIKVGILSIDNVYDIPYNGTIIEKDQPLSTVITCENNIKDAENKIKEAISNVNRNILPIN